MPKMYSMKDIIDAWDQAYFEDLRELVEDYTENFY